MPTTDLDKSMAGSKRAGETYLGPSLGKVNSQENIITITATGITSVDLNVTLIQVNAAGAVTIQLPKTANTTALPGTMVDASVTIIDLSGAAVSNPITILPFAGELIVGQVSIILSNNYGAVVLGPLTSGGWAILSYSTPADSTGGYVVKSGDAMTGKLQITGPAGGSADPGIAVFTDSNLLNIFDGTFGGPYTSSLKPTAYIYRNESITAAFSYAPALMVGVTGVATTGGYQTQAIAAAAAKDATSDGDICAIGGNASHFGTNGTAFGAFFSAHNVNNAWSIAVETETGNGSGTDYPYQATPGFSPIAVGFDIVYSGATTGGGPSALGSAAILVRTVSDQWDVGIGFMAGDPVKTAEIQSDTDSIHMYYAHAGAHTNGINLTGATFSANAFSSPGFAVNGIGAVTATSVPANGFALDLSGSITPSVANGANTPLFTVVGGYFIGIRNGASGTSALYFASAATVTMLAEIGSEFVTPTTTPAAGKSSIGWDGAASYRVYNNSGSATVYSVGMTKF